MKIHSRGILQEGIGADSKHVLSSMNDLRDGMKDLLSPEGGQLANPKQATQTNKQGYGYRTVSMMLSPHRVGLSKPNPVTGDITTTKMKLLYRRQGSKIFFSDDKNGQLEFEIPKLRGLPPTFGVDYQIRLLRPQTLFKHAKNDLFWFHLVKMSMVDTAI